MKLLEIALLGSLKYMSYSTVETYIKEPRFFLSSLGRLLISGLVFLFPACKVLNKVLTYSTCLHASKLLSIHDFFILENTLKSEFLYNDIVICCAT